MYSCEYTCLKKYSSQYPMKVTHHLHLYDEKVKLFVFLRGVKLFVGDI